MWFCFVLFVFCVCVLLLLGCRGVCLFVLFCFDVVDDDFVLFLSVFFFSTMSSKHCRSFLMI